MNAVIFGGIWLHVSILDFERRKSLISHIASVYIIQCFKDKVQ